MERRPTESFLRLFAERHKRLPNLFAVFAEIMDDTFGNACVHSRQVACDFLETLLDSPHVRLRELCLAGDEQSRQQQLCDIDEAFARWLREFAVPEFGKDIGEQKLMR